MDRLTERYVSSHLTLAKTQKFDHKRRPSRSLGFGFARLRPARAALRFRVPLFEDVIGSEASAKAETGSTPVDCDLRG